MWVMSFVILQAKSIGMILIETYFLLPILYEHHSNLTQTRLIITVIKKLPSKYSTKNARLQKRFSKNINQKIAFDIYFNKSLPFRWRSLKVYLKIYKTDHCVKSVGCGTNVSKVTCATTHNIIISTYISFIDKTSWQMDPQVRYAIHLDGFKRL